VKLCRVTFRQACDFVGQYHRHHRPPQGHVVSIGLRVDGELVGVAMLGRPVSRHKDDGATLEIIRLCVRDGVPNGCSWLLTRAKRLAQAMGCNCITYTLEDEGGASLRAAGWKCEGKAGGGEWTRPSRERGPSDAPQMKLRWSAPLDGQGAKP